MLRLVDVGHRFGRQVALDRVSLHVRRGDCYGFVGHNGAGKTTAMRVALGLVPTQRGRVIVDGFDAARHPREARARIGALIETPGFHGGWSGRANLELLARLAGMERRTARAAAASELERVGLAAAADRHVAGYSQGMRQRLGLAQALLGGPRLLLLDEPTNGLDPEGIADVRALLARLRDEGITVLVSSHHIDELAGVCNRVGILREGRLVLEEETARLVADEGRAVVLDVERPDLARAALARLGVAPGRIRAASASSGAVPAARLEVELEEGGPTRPELSRALVEAGAGLDALRPREASLSEVVLARSAAAGAHAAPSPGSSSDAAPAHAAEPRERLAPRHATARVVRHELERWRRSGGVWLLAAAPAVAGAAAVLRRALAARADARELADETLFSATAVNAFEGVAVALQAALPLCAFVLLGLATQSFAGEAARGTLRNVLLRPLRRSDVFLGKALALVGMALVAFALAAGTAVAASAVAFDFGGVVEVLPNGAELVLVEAAELVPGLREVLTVPILPLCAYACLGLAVGARARSGASALGAGLALGVVLDLARAPLRGLGREGWSLAAHLPSPLADRSVVAWFVDVARGIGNARLEPGAADPLVPIAWAVAALSVAGLVFVRKDVP